MNRLTPADRDRAQRRVRLVTAATVAGAAALTLGGAAAAAGTFGGRTVSADQAGQPSNPAPTDDSGLQAPAQAPAVGNGGYLPPVTSGGS